MTILQMPVRQFGLMVKFARASTCGARLLELLDAELDIEDAPGARDLVVTAGVLRFDNVGFRYAGSGGRPTLSGISFEASNASPSRQGECSGLPSPSCLARIRQTPSVPPPAR